MKEPRYCKCIVNSPARFILRTFRWILSLGIINRQSIHVNGIVITLPTVPRITFKYSPQNHRSIAIFIRKFHRPFLTPPPFTRIPFQRIHCNNEPCWIPLEFIMSLLQWTRHKHTPNYNEPKDGFQLVKHLPASYLSIHPVYVQKCHSIVDTPVVSSREKKSMGINNFIFVIFISVCYTSDGFKVLLLLFCVRLLKYGVYCARCQIIMHVELAEDAKEVLFW